MSNADGGDSTSSFELPCSIFVGLSASGVISYSFPISANLASCLRQTVKKSESQSMLCVMFAERTTIIMLFQYF